MVIKGHGSFVQNDLSNSLKGLPNLNDRTSNMTQQWKMQYSLSIAGNSSEKMSSRLPNLFFFNEFVYSENVNIKERVEETWS